VPGRRGERDAVERARQLAVAPPLVAGKTDGRLTEGRVVDRERLAHPGCGSDFFERGVGIAHERFDRIAVFIGNHTVVGEAHSVPGTHNFRTPEKVFQFIGALPGLFEMYGPAHVFHFLFSFPATRLSYVRFGRYAQAAPLAAQAPLPRH